MAVISLLFLLIIAQLCHCGPLPHKHSSSRFHIYNNSEIHSFYRIRPSSARIQSSGTRTFTRPYSVSPSRYSTSEPHFATPESASHRFHTEAPRTSSSHRIFTNEPGLDISSSSIPVGSRYSTVHVHGFPSIPTTRSRHPEDGSTAHQGSYAASSSSIVWKSLKLSSESVRPTFRPLPQLSLPIIPLPSASMPVYSAISGGSIMTFQSTSVSPQPSYSAAVGPKHTQTKTLRVVVAWVAGVAGLLVLAVAYILWRVYLGRNRDGELVESAKAGVPSNAKDPDSGDLPGIPPLSSAFGSAQDRILRIGASLVDFEAVADSSSSSHESHISVPEDGEIAPAPRTPSIGALSGEFASALARAFGSPPKRTQFPISAYLTNSTTSPVSTRLTARRPETMTATPIQSLRGSITEALSMISAPDRLSGADHLRESNKSVKSSKSTRSRASARLRSSISFKISRKSATSFVTLTPSFNTAPSPDPADVHALFSGSQESISLGMPSAPPTSFADPINLLDKDILVSPLQIPSTFLSSDTVRKAGSPPRIRIGRASIVPQDPHIAALETSLLFNSSLSILPPASPSSDGVRYPANSSQASTFSSDPSVAKSLSPSSSGLGSAFRERIQDNKNEVESIGSIGTPPSASSMFSHLSSRDKLSPTTPPVMKKSLSLAEAMDMVETDALYASFPTTPDKMALSPSHSSRSILSLISELQADRTTDKTSPASERQHPSPPPDRAIIAVTDFDDRSLPTSVDITSHHGWSTPEESSKSNVLEQHDLPASQSRRSAISITIGELLKEKDTALSTSLSDEIPLDGMDIVDLTPPTSPDHHIMAIEYAPAGILPVMEFNNADSDFIQVFNERPPSSLKVSLKTNTSTNSGSGPSIRAGLEESLLEVDRVSGASTRLSPPRSLGHSFTSSNSLGRISVSVFPGFDETTDLIEQTLLEMQKNRRRLSGGVVEDVDGEVSDDDDDLDSFEGDVSYVRSPAYSARSDRLSDEERASEDSPGRHWVSAYDYGFMEEADVANSSFVDDLGSELDLGIHGNDFLYHYDYIHRSRVPRQAEVAFRAIAREGRLPDLDRLPLRSSPDNGLKAKTSKRFAPIVSSPLRASHRAVSRDSNGTGGRNSDGSVYSQVSGENMGVKASGTGWSNVF